MKHVEYYFRNIPKAYIYQQISIGDLRTTQNISDNRSGNSERLKMGPIGPARGGWALSTDGLGAARSGAALFESAVGPSRMDLGLLETHLGVARGGWALPAHGWGLNHTFARML